MINLHGKITSRLYVNKVSKSIGILRRMHNIIPESILRNLYYTLINPYFEYCNIIWATNSTGTSSKTFPYTKARTLRLITKSQWNAHTDPLFRQYKMLTIYKLNQLQVGCFMYKVYKRSLPQYFIDMFSNQIQQSIIIILDNVMIIMFLLIDLLLLQIACVFLVLKFGIVYVWI